MNSEGNISGRLRSTPRLPAGEVDEIDLVFDHLDELARFIDFQSAGLTFGAGNAVFQQEVGAHALADSVQHHDGEAGAVFQAAAPLVLAVVFRGGEEFAEQPLMRAVHEAHLEAGVLQVVAGFGKVIGTSSICSSVISSTT